MAPLFDDPLSDSLHEPTSRSFTSSTMASTRKFIGAVEDEWSLYSDRASDYTIGEPIGYGASSIVYAATYHPQPTDPANPPPSIPCALKVLDLDSLPPRSLQLLQRETRLMSLSKHPNVLRVRGSWMDGHKLYIALRLMNKGSAADVMRYGWPGGMEEDVVRCILRQALKGLNYLHINGFIHRDIKAANLLIDDDGTVLLGDLGVAADLSEDTSHHMLTSFQTGKAGAVTATAALSQSQHQRRTIVFDGNIKMRPKIGKRKSFVGTPCWMAPELIQGHQYDSSADIWSFGITALELTQGRPPRSRESPKDVLLRIIQDAAPTLDREGGTYKYTRAFKEMVDSCLEKDPSKRPTAEQLLQTPFFRNTKKKGYLINTILKDLPPLARRQERRTLRQSQTMQTIDSWDFATTVHSPLTSARRRALGDVALHTTDPERQEGVFYFDDEHELDDLRKADHNKSHENDDQQSTTSSEGNRSTDAAEPGLSTPPTNPSSFVGSPPSPRLLMPHPPPTIQSSLVTEAPVKKHFWSRITSNVRRSPKRVLSSTMLNSGAGQHPISPPEPTDIRDGRPGTSPTKHSEPSRGLSPEQKKSTPVRRPATSHGYAGVVNSSSLRVFGRATDHDIADAAKPKRPVSRGSLLGGMVGGRSTLRS